MLRSFIIVPLIVMGGALRTAAVPEPEVCPPVDGVSEPDDDAPDIVGTSWSSAQDVLAEEGYDDIDPRPTGLDPVLLEDAIVVDWAIDPPTDDASPLDAVVCLGGEVPDLAGETAAGAASVLRAAGFALVPPSDGVGDDWSVTGQRPAGGTLALFGTPVEIALAPPDVFVPDVVGGSVDEARSILADAGLVLGQVDGPIDGVIVRQSPPAGDPVPPGQAVDVVTEAVPIPEDTTAETTPVTPASPVTTQPPDTTTTAPEETEAPPSSSTSSPAAAITGVSAGAVGAIALGGLLVTRRNRRRWRRRVRTVTQPEVPTSIVTDDGPARVVRAEWTPDEPDEHVEERDP